MWGGLGIRNLNVMNEACLSKLIWRLVTEREGLWIQVLKAIYNKGREFNFSENDRGSNASHLWADLSNIWSKVGEQCVWQMGNGGSFDFWRDCWVDKNVKLIDFVADHDVLSS